MSKKSKYHEFDRDNRWRLDFLVRRDSEVPLLQMVPLQLQVFASRGIPAVSFALQAVSRGIPVVAFALQADSRGIPVVAFALQAAFLNDEHSFGGDTAASGSTASTCFCEDAAQIYVLLRCRH